LAVVYIHTNDHERGRALLDQALAIYADLKAYADISSVYNALGHIAASKNDPDEALRYFEQALQIVEEHKYHGGSAIVLSNICSTLTRLGRIDEAETILHRLDEIGGVYASPYRVRQMSRAKIAEARGNTDEAKRILLETLDVANDKLKVLDQLALHEALRDLARTMMDFDAYITHNEQYNAIKEQIQGAEVTRRIAATEAERNIAGERAEREKERAVLYSTLPKHIADLIVRGEQVTGDHYENAAVFFVDIVGFTTLSDQLSASEVVSLLERLYSQFDEICKRHDVTKIKTIGDSYMAVAFPNTVPRDARDDISSEQRVASLEERAARAALDMLDVVANAPSSLLKDLLTDLLADLPNGLQVRIGLHNGPVTAGVIGTERLQYDVWGDTVNVASRMESTGEPGKIHVSEAFAQFLTPIPSHLRERGASIPSTNKGDDVIPSRSPERSEGGARNEDDLEPGTWHLAPRGEIELKGKGLMSTYWLEGNS
ncbi:MAG: tetratricopeptide repeat protein, partial [Ignavibacteriae bacterium]